MFLLQVSLKSHTMWCIFKILLHVKNLDEDLLYPASELNSHSHGPDVLGWRSKNSGDDKSPKEIVLKFHFPATIQKIQVLAHQFLIRKSSNKLNPRKNPLILCYVYGIEQIIDFSSIELIKTLFLFFSNSYASS